MSEAIPERLAVVETRLDHHDNVHVALNATLAEIKDRMFNVLLVVSGACVMAVVAMGAYVLHAHGF